MPAKKSTPTATEPVVITETPNVRGHVTTEEAIRARAFQLYEERGRIDGHAEEDWAQAELEILSREAGKSAA